MLDSVAGTRRQITRTTGNEANPRWARRESAVTFTRDNNLFLVPLDSGELTQLTDVQPKQARSARDRQPEVRQGRRAEADRAHAHRSGEEEEGRGEGQGARAAEVRARRTPDGQRSAALPRRHARLRPRRRARRRRPSGPTCRTTSPSRATPRTFPPGPSSATRRTSAAVGHESDDRQGGRGTRSVAQRTQPSRQTSAAQRTQRYEGHKGAKRTLRWGMPQLSDDGSIAVAHVRADDNKDRWLRRRGSGVGQDAGRSTRCTTMRGCREVRRRRAGRSVVRLDAGSEARVVPLGARRLDAPVLRRRDRRAAGGASADAGQVGDRRRRPVARQEALLHHQHRSRSGRAPRLRAGRSTAASGRS